jgi:hypothetical protein
MDDETKQGIFTALIKMPRFAPALFSIFIFGILLLFLNELPKNMKAYTIPSLLIYSIGAVLIGTFHRFIALHYEVSGSENNEKTIPVPWRVFLYLSQLLWVVAFVYYNCWRSVL